MELYFQCETIPNQTASATFKVDSENIKGTILFFPLVGMDISEGDMTG